MSLDLFAWMDDVAASLFGDANQEAAGIVGGGAGYAVGYALDGEQGARVGAAFGAYIGVRKLSGGFGPAYPSLIAAAMAGNGDLHGGLSGDDPSLLTAAQVQEMGLDGEAGVWIVVETTGEVVPGYMVELDERGQTDATTQAPTGSVTGQQWGDLSTPEQQQAFRQEQDAIEQQQAFISELRAEITQNYQANVEKVTNAPQQQARAGEVPLPKEDLLPAQPPSTPVAQTPPVTSGPSLLEQLQGTSMADRSTDRAGTFIDIWDAQFPAPNDTVIGGTPVGPDALVGPSTAVPGSATSYFLPSSSETHGYLSDAWGFVDSHYPARGTWLRGAVEAWGELAAMNFPFYQGWQGGAPIDEFQRSQGGAKDILKLWLGATQPATGLVDMAAQMKNGADANNDEEVARNGILLVGMLLGMLIGGVIAEEGVEPGVEREPLRDGEGAAAGEEGAAGRPTRTQPTGQRGQKPTGRRTTIPRKADDAFRRGLERENESADTLADNGYNVEQNPKVPGPKKPDFRIEGEIYDNYAPSTNDARNIVDVMRDKAGRGQADRIVLNLDDSLVQLDEIKTALSDFPISKLREIIIVKGGNIILFYP